MRVSGPDLLQQTLHGLIVAPPPGLPAVTLPPVWAGDRERHVLAVSSGGQATGESTAVDDEVVWGVHGPHDCVTFVLERSYMTDW